MFLNESPQPQDGIATPPATIARLLQELGTTAVTTDPDTLDAYSHDTWAVGTVLNKLGRHPYRADVVVRVTNTTDVQRALQIACAAKVPVTVRGLGSSVTGQALPQRGGVVLDLTELQGEPELNVVDQVVTVPAGVQGGKLEEWLNVRGYTLRHSPQSLFRSTVGGWVATRATGHFSSRYGGIEDLAVGYSVVLSDGTLAAVGQRPRAAMGPDLRHIFLGSEGTLGVVTSVSLKVFASPDLSTLEAFCFTDLEHALSGLQEIAQSGLRPHLVRLYDQDEVRHSMPTLPADRPIMFTGTEGLADVATAEQLALNTILTRHGAKSLGPDPVESWMRRRFDYSAIEDLLAESGGYAETIEVAHYWSRIRPMYYELKESLAPLADEVLGHFSHIYQQGTSLYVIMLGRAQSDEVALERLQKIWRTAMEVVVSHGGEVSHHHGGGLARSPWVRESLGSSFEVLRRLKVGIDDARILNPGKLGLDIFPSGTE